MEYMLLLSRERERERLKKFLPFFFCRNNVSLSFSLSFPQSFQLSKCHQVFLIRMATKRPTKKNRPHTKEKKEKKKHTKTPAATSETHHPIGLTKVEKTKTTTTTKRGDHRDETRERETSFFVSARLPETTTTSFCRERKRERRAKALYKRAVFVAINQFERRKR